MHKENVQTPYRKTAVKFQNQGLFTARQELTKANNEIDMGHLVYGTMLCQYYS